MNTESLSIFFPAYNDAETIPYLVRSYYEEALKYAAAVEVIVVNDGSADNTGSVLDALAATMPALRVVHHAHNRGYGAALQSGFSHARGDLIFYTDGDGQYRADDLHKLFEALTVDADIVNGYKIARGDGWVRRGVGNLYKAVVRVLFGIRVRDVDCDYRLIRKRAMDNMQLQSRTGVICTEMVYKWQKNGCRIAEVPVHHYPRMHGRSQFFGFRHLKNALIGLLVLWFNLRIRPSGPR